MKKLLSICAFVFFLASFSGCEKESTTPETTLEDVLIGTTWQSKEVRALEANVTYYYKRGSVNTWDLDDEYVKFDAGGTGVYGDANGTTTTPITWAYTNAAKTGLQFVIAYSTPLTVTWENMAYTSTSLFYTQYLTRSGGINSLASGTRIAK